MIPQNPKQSWCKLTQLILWLNLFPFSNRNWFYYLCNNRQRWNCILINGSNLIVNEVRRDQNCQGEQPMVHRVIRVNRRQAFAVNKKDIQIVPFVINRLGPNPNPFGTSISRGRHLKPFVPIKSHNSVLKETLASSVLSHNGNKGYVALNLL